MLISKVIGTGKVKKPVEYSYDMMAQKMYIRRMSIFIMITMSMLLLVISSIGNAYPLTIYGLAEYENGEIATNATVVVSADDLPNETDVTENDGAWQVDVGGDTGTKWPENTTFTVTITKGSWIGTKTGVLQNSHTGVGTVILENTDTNQNPTNMSENRSESSIRPVAIISNGPFIEGIANTSITFNASESYDPDGNITGYRWDFNGDGTNDTGWLSTPSISHTFETPEIYTLLLEVKDDGGHIDLDYAIVDISDEEISITIQAKKQGLTSQNITFQSLIPVNLAAMNFSWNFGDDTVGYGPTTSHIFTSPGNYYVRLLVEDEQGKIFHDVHIIEIKLDTDKDLLHDDLEKSIGSPIWTKNYYSSVQIHGKTHLLIDTDNNGYIDVFYNKTRQNFSQVQLSNDKYLIDDDLDGKYEFSFDKTTGKIEEYVDTSQGDNGDNTQETPGVSFILLILIISSVSYFSYRKKKYS